VITLAGGRRLASQSGDSLTRRLVGIYLFLAVFNLGAWVWAFIAFHGRPVMLGVALVVYGLGLRHAVDADHIAAIDNVTRKLMQQGRRSVSVGLFFALGHSSIVIGVTAALAGLATVLAGFQRFQVIGGLVSTAVSSLFLIAIAAINIVIYVSIFRTYRQVRAGGAYIEEDLDMLLGNRGFLSRLMKPLFGLIRHSWQMFPLGLLFGLGFDTATEVAVFGISAAQAAKGVSTAATLVFPVLFAAGMSLLDTTDGVLMLRAYDWAFIKPMRKLFYNMTITLISVAVALLIGGIEGFSLLRDQLRLAGPFWDTVAMLGANMNVLGLLIIGLFAASWLVSFIVYKVKRLDAFEVASPDPR
jgi:high-affinity nickel-transport protein